MAIFLKTKIFAVAMLGTVSLAGVLSCSVEEPKKSTTKEDKPATGDDAKEEPVEEKKKPVIAPNSPKPPADTVVELPLDPANEAFFFNTVTKAFDRSCASCHAEPRFKPATPGPLSIFAYQKMRGMLLTGVSEQSNSLMDKIRGIASHGGGNRCVNGFTDSPCSEIGQWFKMELKSNPKALKSPGAAGVSGALTSYSTAGKISGYAVNTSNTTQSLSVKFYLNGAAGVGTALGTVMANLPGSGGGFTGNNSFSYDLPTSAADGNSKDLYLYALLDGAEKALPGNPYKVTAYTPKQAGRDYYEATLRPLLQSSCANCHVIGYSQHYVSLISPTPAAGGTALLNEMINRPSGSVSHPGGNVCGGKNGGLCVQIQQWWAREFGP